MAEHAGKPEVRFAGFTEAWEQRKLGDLLVESKIKGHPGNVAKKLTVKLWGKGVVEKNDFGGSIYTQYYIRKYEQFIYSKLDFLNSAFAVIPKNMDGYESTADLPAFDCVNSNPYFIFYRVTQKDFYLKNGAVADGSRKAKRIHVDTFLGMEITAPNFLEQDKIVHFFQVLDRLITLHQRKRGRLENIKKAMLEKMFPKNGADVPEVRFAGFTEAWEQRKLGELGSVAMCKRIFKDQTSEEGDVPFYKIGTFGEEPDAYISRELFDEYKSKYPYPDKGTILISASGSIGRVVEFAGKDEYFQDSNIVWLKHDKRIADTFLKYIYEVISWAGIEGSTIKRLYNDNILKTEVKLPCIDEQEHIGRFFRHLDRLITLHQRKVALLQNIKKACLEKMFV